MRLRSAAAGDAVQMPVMPEVFVHGQPGVEAGRLEGHADLMPDFLRLPRHIKPEDVDRSRLHGEQGAEDAKQRGFAAAVGAEQSENGFGSHGEGEVIQGQVFAVPMG